MVHSAGIAQPGTQFLGVSPFQHQSGFNKTVSGTYQPVIDHTPVIVGLFGSDPTSNFDEIFAFLKDRGVLGILNYPSVSLIDGQFRERLRRMTWVCKRSPHA